MLTSVKIQKRQSEIRQQLAALAGKDKPDETEIRSMSELDTEYSTNETRYRAALVSEAEERREHGAELETRSDKEYADLIGRFELRQVAAHLDTGHKIDGATAEVIEEYRSKGAYRGLPVPYEALEIRSGETVASGVPAPVATAPIIDRIFAVSVASKMGTRFINIPQGQNDYPITSSSVTGGWANGETASVAGPTQYTSAARSLAPGNTYGIQMKVTRKALQQTGSGLEDAVRRDMNGCLAVGMDKAVFQGAGSNGEPAGILVGSYSITSTSVAAAPTWAVFRSAVRRFMIANAISSPSEVNLLVRPEVWDKLDNTLITNTAVSELDRLLKNVPNFYLSSNALAAPTGSPAASKALLTCSAQGVAPIFVGTWGAIDLIRDVYSDAASGGLRLTALATMDVTASRAEQLQILTGVQAA